MPTDDGVMERILAKLPASQAAKPAPGHELRRRASCPSAINELHRVGVRGSGAVEELQLMRLGTLRALPLAPVTCSWVVFTPHLEVLISATVGSWDP